MRARTLRGSVAAAVVAVVATLPAASPPAHAESSACTVVSSLPATLSVPGRYCLAQDFTIGPESGLAILITADDVDLDCNDHVIHLNAPAGNSAFGVQVQGERRGVRVRNCGIDGFEYGLFVSGGTGGGARLQGNRIVRAGSYGIFVSGNNNLVEDNFVGTQRGGSSTYPNGIYLSGEPDRAVGNVVRRNTVTDMQPEIPASAGSAGIAVRYQHGTVIEDNVVTAIRSRAGAGSYGIITDHATHLTVRGNTVLSPNAPGAPPFDGGNYSGIFLQSTIPEAATNMCSDNVVGHFNGNITGCTLGANTDL
jgi:hypothetical protein